MRSTLLLLAVGWAVTTVPGCSWCSGGGPDGRHRSDVIDHVFKQRDYDPNSHAGRDPVMCLARQITVMEDDLRRDGTITVKKPDVWGDGNLMYFLQEFDGLLQARTQNFGEVLQGYIARSDLAELQSTTALAAALGPATGSATPGASAVAATGPATATTAVEDKGLSVAADAIKLDKTAVFELITKSRTAAPPAQSNLGVEPTELARQHATYIDVCQALRRRHMGDDTCRAAGYGLYKFRVPVSVLPGRETSQGYSAVVTLRAQLQVDEAHLKYTFPKLVVADLVDQLTPLVIGDWAKPAPTTPQLTALSNVHLAIGMLRDTLAAKRKDLAAETPDRLQEFVVTIEALAQSLKTQVLNSETEAAIATAQTLAQTLSKTLAQTPVPEDLQKLFADAAVTAAFNAAFQSANAMSSSLQERGFGPRGDAPGSQATPLEAMNPREVFGAETIAAVCKLVKEQIRSMGPPRDLEIRAALFRVLTQAASIVEQNDALCPDEQCPDCVHAAAEALQHGVINETFRDQWFRAFDSKQLPPGLPPGKPAGPWREAGWAVAQQSGILDINLKRIYEELRIRGKVSEADAAGIKGICFFRPADRPVAARYWQTIVKETFPLYVFAIDPEVEEQNVYDAFARRRELQLAVAYSVAKGRVNMAQKLAFSRQLALDQADIALNRTVVGFSHGEDTFGWYFYPRVQTPPTESTNLGAVVRTVWSTGPTEHYDLKHRKLEPGMRECEVLIAMPSFVTQVSFDVTSNWESLCHPGVTKRTYEEMVAQGGRMQRLKMSLANLCGPNCYRPGDVERLGSRVEQLEQMLGMQTYCVGVPYEYEQSGHDLFDTGNVHLRPELTGYYGLEYLQSGDTADGYVFLAGKNFHPSLTHVIIGGRESHSLTETAGGRAEVEVINRELLRVHVTKLNEKLSQGGFQVRAGTPAGMSNPLTILPSATAEAPKGWSFAPAAPLTATFENTCCANQPEGRKFTLCRPKDLPPLKQTLDVPMPQDMNGVFLAKFTAAKKDGTQVLFGNHSELTTADAEEQIPLICDKKGWKVDTQKFEKALTDLIRRNVPRNEDQRFTITITGYLAFNKYPVMQVFNEAKIEVEPCPCGKPCDGSTPNDKPTPAAAQPKSSFPLQPDTSHGAEVLPAPVPTSTPETLTLRVAPAAPSLAPATGRPAPAAKPSDDLGFVP